MKTRTSLAALLLALMLPLANGAQAAFISVDPADLTPSVGSTVDVALNISGLGDGPDFLSLGAFDFDVTWDASVLSLQNVTFGDPGLGDQLDPFALGSVTGSTIGSGSGNLFEVSLDFPWDLDNLQAGAFTMATLQFDALAVGTSAVDLTVNALGDAWGDPIPVQVVNASVDPIPEPASAILFCVGGAIVGRSVRKRLVRS